MKMLKKTLALILSIVMVLGLCSCAFSRSKKQVIIGTSMSVSSAMRGEYNFDMLSSGIAQPPVIWCDSNGEYHPLIANITSADSIAWTVTIEEGMCWSDGEPVVVEDIFEAIRQEEKDDVIKSMDTSKSPTSGCIILKEANPRYLSDLVYIRPVPSHLGDQKVEKPEDQIWCGPYVLTEFNKESDTLTFTVNDKYPKKPNVETVIVKMFGNNDTMYLALEDGDIDFVWNYSAGVPADYIKALKDKGTVDLTYASSLGIPAVLVFNAQGDNERLGNLAFKMAISYSLDYSQFAEYLGVGDVITPKRGIVPPATVGYTETEQLEYNKKLAGEYFKKSGFYKESSDPELGYCADDGAKIVLTVNSSKESHIAYAELIKTQLAKVNIEVVIEAIDSASYNAKTSNKFSENKITMESALMGFTAAGMGMGEGLGSIYIDESHPVQGACQVGSRQFKQLLSTLAEAKSIDEYKLAAAEMQQYYADECVAIPLCWDSMCYASSKNVKLSVIDNYFGYNTAETWFTIK